MLDAESAPRKTRQAVKRNCFAIIERLWAMRASLPRGAKPLGRIDEAIAAIAGLVKDQRTIPAALREAGNMATNPWLEFAIDSYFAEKRMFAITYLTAVLEMRFDQEREWVANVGGRLSDTERGLISMLDNWLNEKIMFISAESTQSVADIAPNERGEKILKELESLSLKQQEAIGKLRSALISQTTDPPENA